MINKEISLIGAALVLGKSKNLLNEVQDIVSPFMDNPDSINLKTISKLEVLLDSDLISVPSDSEWLIINRRRKLEHLKNLNNENTDSDKV